MPGFRWASLLFSASRLSCIYFPVPPETRLLVYARVFPILHRVTLSAKIENMMPRFVGTIPATAMLSSFGMATYRNGMRVFNDGFDRLLDIDADSISLPMPSLSTSVEMLTRSFERKTFVSGRSVNFDLFDDPERDRVTPISLRDITHPFRTTVNEVKFLSNTRQLIHSLVARLE